jgi:hypothetical protein
LFETHERPPLLDRLAGRVAWLAKRIGGLAGPAGSGHARTDQMRRGPPASAAPPPP